MTRSPADQLMHDIRNALSPVAMSTDPEAVECVPRVLDLVERLRSLVEVPSARVVGEGADSLGSAPSIRAQRDALPVDTVLSGVSPCDGRACGCTTRTVHTPCDFLGWVGLSCPRCGQRSVMRPEDVALLRCGSWSCRSRASDAGDRSSRSCVPCRRCPRNGGKLFPFIRGVTVINEIVASDPNGVSVYGPDVVGCKRHNRDVMIAFFQPAVGTSTDVFLTREQAEDLVQRLTVVLRG